MNAAGGLGGGGWRGRDLPSAAVERRGRATICVRTCSNIHIYVEATSLLEAGFGLGGGAGLLGIGQGWVMSSANKGPHKDRNSRK